MNNYNIVPIPRTIGFHVKLTERASNRTKNRLKEHGPIFSGFELREIPPEGIRLGLHIDGPAIRLINDTWHGWVPADEIEVTIIAED